MNASVSVSVKVGDSMREEGGLHADSNDESSLRGGVANSVGNGGRPQRRTKSKNSSSIRRQQVM